VFRNARRRELRPQAGRNAEPTPPEGAVPKTGGADKSRTPENRDIEPSGRFRPAKPPVRTRYAQTRNSAWLEINRVTSQGPEWHHHLKPIVLLELRAAPRAFAAEARDAAARVIEVLDSEMDSLEDDGQGRAMSFLYDQFTARRLVFPPDRSKISGMEKITLGPLQSIPSTVPGTVRKDIKSTAATIADMHAAHKTGDEQRAYLIEIRNFVEAGLAQHHAEGAGEQSSGAGAIA
jgi:hypothetical protein